MSIALTVKYSIQEKQDHLYSYDFMAEVTNAVSMPTHIFVFQRKVLSITDSEGNNVTEQFVCIASPADFDEMPENSPDLDNNMPFYRKASLTLRFKAMSELEEAKEIMDNDLTKLIRSLKAAENMQEVETKTYE